MNLHTPFKTIHNLCLDVNNTAFLASEYFQALDDNMNLLMLWFQTSKDNLSVDTIDHPDPIDFLSTSLWFKVSVLVVMSFSSSFTVVFYKCVRYVSFWYLRIMSFTYYMSTNSFCSFVICSGFFMFIVLKSLAWMRWPQSVGGPLGYKQRIDANA